VGGLVAAAVAGGIRRSVEVVGMRRQRRPTAAAEAAASRSRLRRSAMSWVRVNLTLWRAYVRWISVSLFERRPWSALLCLVGRGGWRTRIRTSSSTRYSDDAGGGGGELCVTECLN
jgi:hypothetical protein